MFVLLVHVECQHGSAVRLGMPLRSNVFNVEIEDRPAGKCDASRKKKKKKKKEEERREREKEQAGGGDEAEGGDGGDDGGGGGGVRGKEALKELSELAGGMGFLANTCTSSQANT
ncbi:hypothetical protein HZH68_001956 [Vespula germanica]|uniref:Uncharacterized protein n=1 Tax=Vespula germanica TaxID=30212 RepID=A0A834KV78_VESGE|nr:hypothetical protein HZH68_001956 [Vespula germanica]